ncbi:MAG: hypothetical protein ABSE64_00045 [Vulcanimicrobiaceae bacterium]
MKALLSAAVISALSLLTAASASAQSANFVLIPYEQPGSTDPHAVAITQELTSDLRAAMVNVVAVAPIDHMTAVASAAKICADTNASGILVPEGRYEQTMKQIYNPIVTIIRAATHVEFRLDEFGCDGALRWTKTTTGDTARSGVFNVSNAGADIDAAFTTAVKEAATARGAATIGNTVPVASQSIATVAAAAPSNYLFVPFEEPGVADPRASDMTHSLLKQLQDRKLDVKLGSSVDHLTTLSSAGALCTASGTQAILVPSIRIEQSGFSGRSHASLRLTLLSCSGSILAQGAGEADMGQMFLRNFGASVVGVAERAMIPAEDQLFPSTKAH